MPSIQQRIYASARFACSIFIGGIEKQMSEHIYGAFDPAVYKSYGIECGSESGHIAGQFAVWSKRLNPSPRLVLLSGEDNKVIPYLQSHLLASVFTTAGMLSCDYTWNFENDPPAGLGQFDLVMEQAVLEHLLNPYKHVQDLAAHTKVGGYLMIHAAGNSFPYHRYPIDACRLFPDWFEEIAKRMKLTIIRKSFTSDANIFYMYRKEE